MALADLRLPDREFRDGPWIVHELTDGYRLEDLWVVRTPGAGPAGLPDVLRAIDDAAASTRDPWIVRVFFALRRAVGRLFEWDEGAPGRGSGPSPLTGRTAVAPGTEDSGAGLAPFTLVYTTDQECAVEAASSLVHLVLHLGWAVPPAGEPQLQVAVLVRPSGRLGRLYMAAIRPARHLVVFPALVRQWESAWREHGIARRDQDQAINTKRR